MTQKHTAITAFHALAERINDDFFFRGNGFLCMHHTIHATPIDKDLTTSVIFYLKYNKGNCHVVFIPNTNCVKVTFSENCTVGRENQDVNWLEEYKKFEEYYNNYDVEALKRKIKAKREEELSKLSNDLRAATDELNGI
jgi:hypothetical protein